jgi:hypothetical protein
MRMKMGTMYSDIYFNTINTKFLVNIKKTIKVITIVELTMIYIFFKHSYRVPTRALQLGYMDYMFVLDYRITSKWKNFHS